MSGKNSSTDANDLESLYSQLRLSISAPRIERHAGRSHAVWIADKSLFQVVRKEGKFETFGRHIDNKLYLEYYEALYLLELGRLQLYKDGITLSVEQAYLLLLGEEPTPKYNEYLTYSYLTRAGYILIRHRNQFYSQTFMQAPTETDCVWAWLSNVVENRTVPNYIKKTELYAKVKEQIEGIKQKIKQQDANGLNEALAETLQDCTPIKKPKLDNEKEMEQSAADDIWPTLKEKSFLDFLMSEAEFKQFQNLFQKFDFIKLKTLRSLRENSDDGSDNDDMQVECEKVNRIFSINFDLHLHNNGFKKSLPIPPVMRVLILDSKESFPSHAEISRCCEHLFFTTPLLILSVGDAKQIQAFLYLFT